MMQNTTVNSDGCQQFRVGTPGLHEITWLWMESPLHQSWPIKLMKSTVLPAVSLEQYLVFWENDVPVAYISWAYLSEQGEAQYIANPHSLSVTDWNAGNRLWFIDMIAPKGHMWAVTKHLKNGPFCDQVGHFLRVKKENEVAKVLSVHGKNRKTSQDRRCPKINIELIGQLSSLSVSV